MQILVIKIGAKNMTESRQEEGRAGFTAWRDSVPKNYYAQDRHLRAVLAMAVSDERLKSLDGLLHSFGGTVATKIAPLVTRYEREENLPQLNQYDSFGNRIDEIVFDEAYTEAGRLVWESGIVSMTNRPKSSFEQAALFYLLAQEGEMGHGCPLTCTIGLIRALLRRASIALQDEHLERLVDKSYDSAHVGSQFITEIQGGSDVGANEVSAEPSDDGTYRIFGTKWFCSVAHADQFLVMARPSDAREGTAGLACFLIPREVDGEKNDFEILRIKNKTGTRSMPTAEITFTGAVAFPIGELDDGFKIVISDVLNTSRWLNAVGSVGVMRRAYIEALSYTSNRLAFGSTVSSYPRVQATLAQMKTEWLASLHSTMLLTLLDEAVNDGSISEGYEALYRFLVNANKLVAAEKCLDVVASATELFGGNAAIEDFSVLPRLCRDATVFSLWEGSANVLVAQILRDFSRPGFADAVFSRLKELLGTDSVEELCEDWNIIFVALNRTEKNVERALNDREYGGLHFRDDVAMLMRIVQAIHMMVVARTTQDEVAREELNASLQFITRGELATNHDMRDDSRFMERVLRVLGEDL